MNRDTLTWQAYYTFVKQEAKISIFQNDYYIAYPKMYSGNYIINRDWKIRQYLNDKRD